jgi:hypothetical protein
MADAEEYVVGSLSLECRMGHYSEALLEGSAFSPPIVSGDVKLDEATKGSKAVQRMEVEPSVLQGSPKRLDHRIGKGDLYLSQDARPFLVIQHIIDGSIDVLASRVCDNDRMLGTIVQLGDSFAQYPTDPSTAKSFFECPRQDPPRIVVDHSQENPLGVTLWKPLVIELDLRCPEEGDQDSNYCSEQSCSTPEPFDLSGHLGIVMGSEIASNHIERAAMNPASNGRTRDVRLGKEKAKPSSIPIPGIRRLLLGFGSRRSVESGELPFGTYRQTHAGGWGGSEMPCAFKALQLQRFASRMS